MYGIFTYIYQTNQPNVSKYSIHDAWYGLDQCIFLFKLQLHQKIRHMIYKFSKIPCQQMLLTWLKSKSARLEEKKKNNKSPIQKKVQQSSLAHLAGFRAQDQS